MAEMDDCIGALMKAVDEMGEADNTIFVFTTDGYAQDLQHPARSVRANTNLELR
jgi:arylsulfatase A-like enzyme